jgi:hypothetical protein
MEETRRAEPILMLAERLTCLPRAIGSAFLFVTRRSTQTDARRSAFEPNRDGEPNGRRALLKQHTRRLQRFGTIPTDRRYLADFNFSIRWERTMGTVLIIILILVVFGGGGGYYAHGRYGGAGLGGVLGLVLVILLVLWLVGALGGAVHTGP